MKRSIIRGLKFLGLYKEYRIPKVIMNNYVELDSFSSQELGEVIKGYCKPEKYSTPEERLSDIAALLSGRLDGFRAQHIPFLSETIGLTGKQILEIGCGTGASTLALAEQGAFVTGIDLSEEALAVAKKRLDIYGLNASFYRRNSVEICPEFGDRKWDIIIFFASMEHMTPSERKVSINNAFSILKKGGALCIFGSPNRLWPIDIHTSQLSFYHWLQDEIALDYAVFSPRTDFAKINTGEISTNFNELYRWGRGVSYHEIDVAISNSSQYKIVASLPIFLRRHNIIQRISYKRSSEYKYKKLLVEFGPKNMHPGVYECYIDIIIEKC